MKQGFMLVAVVALGLTLEGCFNLGTKPSEITPAFVPTTQYQAESCQQLNVERSSLYQRESLLTTAQQQRRSSNKLQAFWVGFGNGDGVGAGELAQVKGEIIAVEKELALKQCGGMQTAATGAVGGSASVGGWPLPMPSFDSAVSCNAANGGVAACQAAEQNAKQWLSMHATTVQIAGYCSGVAQSMQSYTMLKSCVQQREASTGR